MRPEDALTTQPKHVPKTSTLTIETVAEETASIRECTKKKENAFKNFMKQISLFRSMR